MTVNAYRAAIDSFKRGEKPEPWIIDEVNKISHRPYSTGFFYGKPTDGSGTQDPSMVTNGGQFFADSGKILSRLNTLIGLDRFLIYRNRIFR